ncbi:methyl-accepting chemotaxis protein [Xylophilus sp. GOD-11R]|uniref:methyl-accepting chemotaxis protein n=1 Tax=Xylophilus sp. GOD-11R TaxID=3089814 RepID=UPI00298D0DF8|nr:methyl-accepting chemotaxis protein [Xylophilus sp. GOD-11R]WPB59326.1 methyl-accepting chemotaxis protein [Xylophilus sp. GOD-11R]
MIRSSSLGVRLGSGYALVCLLLLSVVALVSWQQMRLQSAMQSIVEVDNRNTRTATQMLQQLGDVSVGVRNMALLQTLPELDAEMVRINGALKSYDTLGKSLADQLARQEGENGAEVQQLRKIQASQIGAVPLVLEAAKLGMDGAAPEATQLITEKVRPRVEEWNRQVIALIGMQQQRGEDAYAEARAAHRQGLTALVVCALAAVLASIVIAVRTTRSITRPLGDAVRAAENIAGGDLSSVTVSDRRDEVGRMLQSVGQMQARLREIVGGIREASDSIRLSASEIAAGNQDLSRRTEDTASNLQSAAALLEALAAAVHQSAEAAERATALAATASEAAAEGGTAVSKVVSTMDGISAASRRIGDITGVIDGLAFQTNILALNAAVEAARAGEQGRGFAVVAAEVRSLAQRSAAAAKEIRGLIASSIEQVDTGSALVRNAGTGMQRIVESVGRVTGAIAEIRSSSAQQDGEISQVGDSVKELDRMTQQNSALVEQSAAAAEGLRAQTARLGELIDHFRRDGESPAPPARDRRELLALEADRS